MKRLVTIMSCLTAIAALAANPLSPEGEFISDPAPRVGPDGKLYLFGSRDTPENGAIWCSCWNDIYETTDMTDWRVRYGVLASKGENDGVPETDKLIFAPDGIFLNGKWHIMYCTQDEEHVEGVAVADSIEDPFKSLYQYPWAKQIDPSIFQDDDGKIYYTFGQFDMKMCELKPDLSGPVEGTLRENVVNEELHGFHEGSQLVKRGDMYYLVFADISRRLRPTCIGYATAKAPYGPYTYRGVIVDNYGCDPKTWNNHGGIAEYNGRWYVFYHRATNGEGWLRKPCCEPIEFDENGFIAEVEQTSNGAGPLLDPLVETPARIACVMSGNVRIFTAKDGREYLGGVKMGDSATWRYFDFKTPVAKIKFRVVPRAGGAIVLRDAKGQTYARAEIPAGDGASAMEVEARLSRPFPKGRQAVVFDFMDGRRWGEHGDAELFDLLGFVFETASRQQSKTPQRETKK